MPIKVTTNRGNERKLQVYAEILQYRETNGFGPYMKEISNTIGISVTAVSHYVEQLQKDNLVRKPYGAFRIEL